MTYKSLNLNFENLVASVQDRFNGLDLSFLDDIELVALMGKMASGKNTAADYMTEKHGFHQVSFGSWLKYYAHEFTGIPKEPKPQDLYQWFGQECRKIDPDVWIKCLISDLHWLYKSYEKKKFVITDLRQPNEALFCFEHNFPIFYIYCPDKIRIERIKKRGVEPTPELLDHETEKWMNVLKHDELIFNDGPIEFLQSEIYHALLTWGLVND